MPVLPTSSRGAATSRRILDAAAEEFSERGIAGARVDRIIAAASTNKAQLYGYFGSKDELFDAVVADRSRHLVSAITFDADDLPGSAVKLYNESLRDPALIRLMAWLRLERNPSGRLSERSDHRTKLEGIVRAQAAGKVRAGDPFDLMTLVIGMALAWSPASGVYAATSEEPAADHDRRRALLHESVRRATAP